MTSTSLVSKRNKLLQQLLKNVIYNKHGIIAINKPYGLAVQGDLNTGVSLSDLLEDFAKAKGLKGKPQFAHRLDRDSTGVLLLTRSHSSAQYLAEMFKQREVEKTYWSVVVGRPKYDQGDICIPLREGTVNGRYKIIVSPEEPSQNEAGASGVKVAQTSFKLLADNQHTCSLLELHPITGHKHQLRVHLAEGLGTPILGDHKYSTARQQPQVLPLRLLQMLSFKGVENPKTGKRKIQPWQRALIPMHLHAKEIKLSGLEDEPVVIKAPLPDYFTMTLSRLKLDPAKTKQKISKKEKLYENLQRQLGVSTSVRSGF